ncbi:MAG: hypothetical protein LLF94_07810, partial [Chlamydiales bacterium]|nr:hypothetical protein [Chlamydiales bacterium]
ILHRLHTGKAGPWVNKANLKNPTQPDAVKEAKFIYELEKYRDRKLAKLLLGKEPEDRLSTKTRLQHLLLQLVHPDPTKRGTAQEHMLTMKQILADFEREPQEPDTINTSNDIQEQSSLTISEDSTPELAF